MLEEERLALQRSEETCAAVERAAADQAAASAAAAVAAEEARREAAAKAAADLARAQEAVAAAQRRETEAREAAEEAAAASAAVRAESERQAELCASVTARQATAIKVRASPASHPCVLTRHSPPPLLIPHPPPTALQMLGEENTSLLATLSGQPTLRLKVANSAGGERERAVGPAAVPGVKGHAVAAAAAPAAAAEAETVEAAAAAIVRAPPPPFERARTWAAGKAAGSAGGAAAAHIGHGGSGVRGGAGGLYEGVDTFGLSTAWQSQGHDGGAAEVPQWLRKLSPRASQPSPRHSCGHASPPLKGSHSSRGGARDSSTGSSRASPRLAVGARA